MAERRRSDRGGIARLIRVIDQHGDALEADLIKDNLRLRDCPSEGFDWRDLRIYVKHVGAESNLYKAMFPESAGWNVTTQLLAAITDVAHWFQWVRAGAEGEPPQRITRPGVTNKPKARQKGTPMRLSQAKEVYAQTGPKPMTDDEKLAKLSKIFGN